MTRIAVVPEQQKQDGRPDREDDTDQTLQHQPQDKTDKNTRDQNAGCDSFSSKTRRNAHTASAITKVNITSGMKIRVKPETDTRSHDRTGILVTRISLSPHFTSFSSILSPMNILSLRTSTCSARIASVFTGGSGCRLLRPALAKKTLGRGQLFKSDIGNSSWQTFVTVTGCFRISLHRIHMTLFPSRIAR